MNTAFYRSIAKTLLSAFTIFATSVLLVMTGCSEPSVTTTESAVVESQTQLEEIKLLVVGDESLGPLIKRQWAARRNGELILETISLAALAAADYQLEPDVDVVIYPPGMMGEFFLAANSQKFPKA